MLKKAGALIAAQIDVILAYRERATDET